MAHALTRFITERMDELGLKQRDVVSQSGLSRALVSKYVSDKRERITRLPDRATMEGFAKALRVPVSVLVARAVEALDIGYEAGDFINAVATADNRDLLDEIERRLSRGGGAHARGAAPIDPPSGQGGSVARLFPDAASAHESSAEDPVAAYDPDPDEPSPGDPDDPDPT